MDARFTVSVALSGTVLAACSSASPSAGDAEVVDEARVAEDGGEADGPLDEAEAGDDGVDARDDGTGVDDGPLDEPGAGDGEADAAAERCSRSDPGPDVAELRLVAAEAGGTLYRAYPPGGGEEDSLLVAVLAGEPYEIGRQHGLLLAEQAADVLDSRYSCAVLTSETVLSWMEELYDRLPDDFRDEIRGLADGLAEKGHVFDMPRIVMNATQAFATASGQLPWFDCGPADAKMLGSFSYAVWGGWVAGGGGLAIGSPDWAGVARSLTRNRVLFSIRPAAGWRHVFLGVAGTIGLAGMNETGLAVAGTAGQPCADWRTPIPGNGIAIPEGYMPMFVMGRRVLAGVSAGDPDPFGRLESEILSRMPVDGFITQVTTPGASAVWEPGATSSPGYPGDSRRTAGEWDDGRIVPVDIRGDFLLTQRGVFRISELADWNVAVRTNGGEPYAGTVTLDGEAIDWRVFQLGRAFLQADSAGRAAQFEAWAAGEGTEGIRVVPDVVNGDNRAPTGIVSITADRSRGWWTDGTSWGTWRRDGDAARVYESDGAESCSGPLYDFGVGATGWCDLGGPDLEFIAWTYAATDGAGERLDVDDPVVSDGRGVPPG